jgi:hypothetical protein
VHLGNLFVFSSYIWEISPPLITLKYPSIHIVSSPSMLQSSSNTRKRLLNSSIKFFFSPTSKETASVEAFNNVSTSSNGLVLNITKNIPPKNPVGRPPKLKQVNLVPTNSDGQEEAQVREAGENQLMKENDTLKSSNNGTKSYVAWTDATKALLKFYCHKWGGYNNREHIGWQLGSYVVEKGYWLAIRILRN